MFSSFYSKAGNYLKGITDQFTLEETEDLKKAKDSLPTTHTPPKGSPFQEASPSPETQEKIQKHEKIIHTIMIDFNKKEEKYLQQISELEKQKEELLQKLNAKSILALPEISSQISEFRLKLGEVLPNISEELFHDIALKFTELLKNLTAYIMKQMKISFNPLRQDITDHHSQYAELLQTQFQELKNKFMNKISIDNTITNKKILANLKSMLPIKSSLGMKIPHQIQNEFVLEVINKIKQSYVFTPVSIRKELEALYHKALSLCPVQIRLENNIELQNESEFQIIQSIDKLLNYSQPAKSPFQPVFVPSSDLTLQEELFIHKENLNKCRQLLSEAINEKELYTMQSKQWEEKYEILSFECNQYKDQYIKLQNELLEIRNKNEELKMEQKRLQQRNRIIDEYQEKIDQLEKQLSSKNEEIRATKRQIENISELLEAEEKKREYLMKAKEDELLQAQKEIEQQSEQISKFQEQQKSSTDTDQLINEYEAKIGENKATIESLILQKEEFRKLSESFQTKLKKKEIEAAYLIDRRIITTFLINFLNHKSSDCLRMEMLQSLSSILQFNSEEKKQLGLESTSPSASELLSKKHLGDQFIDFLLTEEDK